MNEYLLDRKTASDIWSARGFCSGPHRFLALTVLKVTTTTITTTTATITTTTTIITTTIIEIKLKKILRPFFVLLFILFYFFCLFLKLF